MSAPDAPLPPPAEEDAPEILNLRVWIILGSICLAAFVPYWEQLDSVVKPPGPRKVHVESWKVGGRERIPITVITSDYNNLACGAADIIDGAHCAMDNNLKAWPQDPSAPLDDNKAHIIQPYSTYPDNHLILVEGLWAQPVVATRLHSEPPVNKPDSQLIRFTVTCDLQFIGRMSGFAVRWRPSDGWARPNTPAFVVRPSNCVIGDE